MNQLINALKYKIKVLEEQLDIAEQEQTEF